MTVSRLSVQCNYVILQISACPIRASGENNPFLIPIILFVPLSLSIFSSVCVPSHFLVYPIIIPLPLLPSFSFMLKQFLNPQSSTIYPFHIFIPFIPFTHISFPMFKFIQSLHYSKQWQ